MKFEKNIININNKIVKAIKLLQDLDIKTIIVIDKFKNFIGTLTDGDIRRGMLKGLTIDSSVSNFVNRKALIYNKKINRKNLKKVELFPVLKRKKLINIVPIYSNQDKTFLSSNIDTLIMAGGFGKRLHPITKKIPKPLIKIKNKPIIENTINHLKKYGLDKVNVSIFYKSEKIKKYFKSKRLKLNINFLNEKKPMGTLGSVSLLNYKNLKKNLLIYNGDIVSNIDLKNFFQFHQNTNSDITICAKEYISSNPFGKLEYTGHKLKKIIEKPSNSSFINAGIYLFKKNVIKNIKKKKIDITDFLRNKMNSKLKINVYPLYEYWSDIGTLESLKQTVLDINKRKK